MSRINILIADNDEQYIDALCKYLLEMYSDRLNIIAFTNKLLLQEYLKENADRADIQLVSSEMLCEGFADHNPRLIYLADIRNTSKSDDVTSIFKYQSAECIASEIFDSFSRLSSKEIDLKSGSHKCNVVSVFSPVGGSGKSTVAAALSKCLSKKGCNTFYLNLETASSALEFFDSEHVSNLSNILYGIKEKSKNLALKIESAISVDSSSGVSFIAPGESPLEMEEMQPEEIAILIDQIRLLGRFDYIVTDMTSSPNANNIEVLKESDNILTITDKSSIAQIKLKSLSRLFEIINQRENISLSQKNILVINKNTSGQIEEQMTEGIARTLFSLPYSQNADPRKMTDELAGFMDTLACRL